MPAVTSYDHGSTGINQQRTWRAEGAGSTIDLSELTSILGGTHFGSNLSVQALTGGSIDLSGVVTILESETGKPEYRRIDLGAVGVSSTITLTSLEVFADSHA